MGYPPEPTSSPDKGYDADWIRDLIEDQDCTPHIPPKSNRYDGITSSKAKYKKRNLIERCFNKLKRFRHIATRYDRSALNYLAMVKIACLRLWLRFYESAAWVIYEWHSCCEARISAATQ
jgi:transposase